MTHLPTHLLLGIAHILQGEGDILIEMSMNPALNLAVMMIAPIPNLEGPENPLLGTARHKGRKHRHPVTLMLRKMWKLRRCLRKETQSRLTVVYVLSLLKFVASWTAAGTSSALIAFSGGVKLQIPVSSSG